MAHHRGCRPVPACRLRDQPCRVHASFLVHESLAWRRRWYTAGLYSWRRVATSVAKLSQGLDWHRMLSWVHRSRRHGHGLRPCATADAKRNGNPDGDQSVAGREPATD